MKDHPQQTKADWEDAQEAWNNTPTTTTPPPPTNQPTKPNERKKRGKKVCAANYTNTDSYNEDECGPIRTSFEEAQRDKKESGYQGVRYVGRDGFLYVDDPEEDAE